MSNERADPGLLSRLGRVASYPLFATTYRTLLNRSWPLVLGAIVTARAVAGPDDLRPPGWKDSSTRIDTVWSGVAVSCPAEHFWWERREGPDFAVFRFWNGLDEQSSAGFYLGDHPSSTLEASPRDIQVIEAVLNGRSVLWVERVPKFEGYRYFETVLSVEELNRSRSLKMHFWLNVASSDSATKWLEWAECFRLEKGDARK